MTNVYLVKTTYLVKGTWYDVVNAVFTNKQKAYSYVRFLNARKAVLEKEGKSYWEERETSLNEYTINTFNWDKEAIEEEAKLLPY